MTSDKARYDALYKHHIRQGALNITSRTFHKRMLLIDSRTLDLLGLGSFRWACRPIHSMNIH